MINWIITILILLGAMIVFKKFMRSKTEDTPEINDPTDTPLY